MAFSGTGAHITRGTRIIVITRASCLGVVTTVVARTRVILRIDLVTRLVGGQAIVVRTYVIVVAIYTRVRAPLGRVAGIYCTYIVVVTNNVSMNAIACGAIARILCTGIMVVTILRCALAITIGIARIIQGTRVVVVATIVNVYRRHLALARGRVAFIGHTCRVISRIAGHNSGRVHHALVLRITHQGAVAQVVILVRFAVIICLALAGARTRLAHPILAIIVFRAGIAIITRGIGAQVFMYAFARILIA